MVALDSLQNSILSPAVESPFQALVNHLEYAGDPNDTSTTAQYPLELR